ncbi:hypothetical protein EF847_21395 [Actinobacteria bacterium YIM 96077]|uniref:Uncharacterized protein n=1 Tax=Phytoactinopolyspora halophila TaxID=1981511 RepID=A0A329QL20_9ACTN|nr:hypothetical protein [Phytoactinopolyspora halophila]AYY14863.1 hypothetical protein EF847_21395 [Actinobacteria bacterium YIM 96077]RAW13137.1 hypothetical protein DPM12_13805 [Phytoactinopolyspora halophila]
MSTYDPWQPLEAGECPVFRDPYSLTLLADGRTPWGYLRVVPVLEEDDRRVDWILDDTILASIRMTDLRFGRRRLSKADYPVIIDPEHVAELTVAGESGTAELVQQSRRGIFRRGSAHIRTTFNTHIWSSTLSKVWYQTHPRTPDEEPIVRIRDHAIQAPERPSSDRTDDWRHTHLLTWSTGATLASLATTHLLRAGTNWAVIGSSVTRASVDGARQHHFEQHNHLLDDPPQH